jgi:hypothetical protein
MMLLGGPFQVRTVIQARLLIEAPQAFDMLLARPPAPELAQYRWGMWKDRPGGRQQRQMGLETNA